MKSSILFFLHNGYRLEETHPDYRKTYLLNITSFLIIATCLFFAFLNLFLVECLANPWFLVGAAVLCMLVLVYFHRTDHIERASELLIAILVVTLIVYFHAVQNQNYGLFWMAGFPPITYFLLGGRKARILSILFFSYILVFILLNHDQWTPAAFNSQSVCNIAGSSLSLLLLVGFHERSRKEAAQALMRANEKQKDHKENLQLILDTAGEGIFGLDMQGICTFCNARGLQLLGYAGESDLAGKSLYPLVYSLTPDQKPVPPGECLILKTIAEGRSEYSDREAFRKADGSFLEVEYYSYPKRKDGQAAGAVVTFNDISQRKRDERQIEYLSSHDLLTGLLNRQQLDKELLRYDRPEYLPLSVVYGDLDGLKLTNDIFGHAAGDDFLRKAAEILTCCKRDNDVLARVGGDEFAWIMPNTGAAGAAERMHDAKSRLESSAAMKVRCSMSMGCATKIRAEEDLLQIYHIAENIMYRNKTARKKGYEKAALRDMTELLHQRNIHGEMHARNTGSLCENMGRALNWPDAHIKNLRDAGYYHDIGKVVLRPELLNKTTTLTPTEEYEKQQHPIIGYRIMNLFDHTLDLADAIYCHHEKWDGSGYPKGLRNVEIPIQSRIIALAEQYDHLRHRRAKDPLSPDEAIRHLEAVSGVHYDPDLVPVFAVVARAFEKQQATGKSGA
jgi:diguanylate cyclase (GGDEF)-like protein/PAS domain S-box-containing protein